MLNSDKDEFRIDDSDDDFMVNKAAMGMKRSRQNEDLSRVSDSSVLISMSIDHSAASSGIAKFMKRNQAEASRFKKPQISEIERRSVGPDYEINKFQVIDYQQKTFPKGPKQDKSVSCCFEAPSHGPIDYLFQSKRSDILT